MTMTIAENHFAAYERRMKSKKKEFFVPYFFLWLDVETDLMCAIKCHFVRLERIYYFCTFKQAHMRLQQLLWSKRTSLAAPHPAKRGKKAKKCFLNCWAQPKEMNKWKWYWKMWSASLALCNEPNHLKITLLSWFSVYAEEMINKNLVFVRIKKSKKKKENVESLRICKCAQGNRFTLRYNFCKEGWEAFYPCEHGNAHSFPFPALVRLIHSRFHSLTAERFCFVSSWSKSR